MSGAVAAQGEAALPGLDADASSLRANLVGIGKSFDGFRALDDVSLALREGEIHAVLGENGAGKTTLVRILSGTLKPDTGYIALHGRKVALSGRRDGATKGIGIVQQHYGLVEELTGTENFLLGHPRGHYWVSRVRSANELRRKSRELELDVDPDRLVRTLTIGERQRLEILIALTVGANILILDEPTAALVTSEVKTLIPVLQRLARQGMSIVYITHKLDEVMEIADQVTVLRRGKVTGRFTRAELRRPQLTEAMIGSLVQPQQVTYPQPGEPVAELFAVSVATSPLRRGLQTIDLTIRRREIVGVAGMVGNGQEALAEVLRGLAEPSEGVMRRASPRVAYIPEDRAHDGLAMMLSIAKNAILYRYREPAFAKAWGLDARAMGKFARELADSAGLSAASPSMPAGALSGGNQQKLVIARELDNGPDLIVAHNPYRGLDVGATDGVRQRLLAARDGGAGIIFISPDLDELFDIASRIVFLSGGKVVGSVDPRSTAVSEVGHFLGGRHAHEQLS